MQTTDTTTDTKANGYTAPSTATEGRPSLERRSLAQGYDGLVVSALAGCTAVEVGLALADGLELFLDFPESWDPGFRQLARAASAVRHAHLAGEDVGAAADAAEAEEDLDNDPAVRAIVALLTGDVLYGAQPELHALDVVVHVAEVACRAMMPLRPFAERVIEAGAALRRFHRPPRDRSPSAWIETARQSGLGGPAALAVELVARRVAAERGADVSRTLAWLDRARRYGDEDEVDPWDAATAHLAEAAIGAPANDVSEAELEAADRWMGERLIEVFREALPQVAAAFGEPSRRERERYGRIAADAAEAMLMLAQDSGLDQSELEGTSAAHGLDLLASDRVAQAIGEGVPERAVALAVLEMASQAAPQLAGAERGLALEAIATVGCALVGTGPWSDVNKLDRRLFSAAGGEGWDPLVDLGTVALDVRTAAGPGGPANPDERQRMLQRAAASVLRIAGRSLGAGSVSLLHDLLDLLQAKLAS